MKDEQTNVLEILYHQPGHLKGVNVLKKVDNYIITGGEDGRICIWDSELSKELVCLYAHKSPIIGIQKLNSEEVIASCSKDLEINLWSLKDFSLIKKVKAHSSALIGVESWDNYLLSAGHDQILKKWRFEDNNLIEENRIKIPDLEKFFIIGSFIAVSHNNGLLMFLNPKDFKMVEKAQIYSSQLIKTIKKSSKYLKPFHKRDPYAVLFDMTRRYGIPVTVSKVEEKQFILGHQFGLVSIWNKSKRKITHLLFVHTKHITGLELIEDILITTSLDSSISTFSLTLNKPLKSIQLKARPLSLLKINDNKILVGLETGEILIFDENLEKEKEISNIIPVTSACITPEHFALGNMIGEVFLLDVDKLEQICRKKISEKSIIAIFYNKNRLITIGEDKQIHILTDDLKTIETIQLEFNLDNPRRVKKYIVLTSNYVFDLDKDEIIKGEVSKQTETELEQFKLLHHEYNRGDVSLFIHKKLLENDTEELSSFYEKSIIDTARKLSKSYETEGYKRKFSSTILSNNSDVDGN